MGRKKIEIRPLTDERNRNVTFLKRKAGLMKKAWELSVLCAADVSLLIFSASGKAYEFSSKELDAEIDRYHDYEGMIERRRAPEFAAMALAGEDDDDEDDDTGRRNSSAKGKAGASGDASTGPARSLKGKETFKQRTVRGDPEGHRRSGKKGKGRAGAGGEGRSKRRAGGGGKRGLSGSGSGSERRGFIDGILSGEDSGSSDEEEQDEEARERGRQRMKEKEMELFRQDVAERTKRRVSAERRATELPVKREHASSSDKMIEEGLQYALGMHAAAPPSFDAHNPYAPPPGPHHTDSYASASSSSQTPLSVPQLPRLGPDAISYRMPSAPALPYSVAGVGMNVPHLPAGMAYQGHPAGMAYYSQGYYGGGGVQQHYMQQQTQQHQHQQSPHGSAPPPSYLNSAQSQSSSQPPSQNYPPGAPGISNLPTPSATGVPPVPPPGGGQWDANLLARYAEYQLQQNHQRQQRVLLERQRQQLAELGVPLDERNLLDEIFGALGARNQGSSASSNASAHGGVTGGGAFGGDVDVGAGGRDDPTGRMDFVWPLGGGPAAHGTPTAGSGVPANGGPGAWMDGLEGMDEQGNGLSLPSPLSADAGEVRRKMAESDEREGGGHKRARVG
ncbi:hypothetical protein IAT38_000657 [Cryptococcus sp. DSM 104549]